MIISKYEQWSPQGELQNQIWGSYSNGCVLEKLVPYGKSYRLHTGKFCTSQETRLLKSVQETWIVSLRETLLGSCV